MISVCLATYNGKKYIEEQLRSILSQLSPEDEIIVSDDHSSDSTLALIRALEDERIRIYMNENRGGVNKNFENALRRAKGDYIFLADQDDVWLPDKVADCLKALESADCVVHDCFITDSDLNVVSKSLFDELNAGAGFLRNLSKNTFTGCCMAFSRQVLNKILPFPESLLFYHDQWIGLIASLSFNTVFLHKPLIYFRRHGANTSSAADKSKLNMKSKILSRLSLAKALLVRYF